MRACRAFLVAVAILWAILLLPLRPARAEAPRGRRVAVLIGSNAAPPARQPLRYAHEDARRLSEVMKRLGRFAPADVQLLFDPRPEEILRAIDGAARALGGDAGETMFVFYYSGHSDGGAIYPHGERMPVTDVRDRVARVGARVRIGILDTCAGGTWTRAKGLTVGPALDSTDLAALSSEGTALVSSSSGIENAHEAEIIKGSFFTHHLVAGMLGAADRSGDGRITLQEAFDYAKVGTIRDSARYAPLPQHPSFDVQLRGRQDVVLTQLAVGASALELNETQGPVEIIHLSSGVTVVEIAPGRQRVRLALIPGKYLVRKVIDNHAFAREVAVAPGQTIALDEAQLESTGVVLARKGQVDVLPVSELTTLPRRSFDLRLAAGVSVGPPVGFGVGLNDIASSRSADANLERSFFAGGSFSWGITDRLEWTLPLPAFTYRFGDPGDIEVFPRIGLTSIGYSAATGVLGSVDGGIGARVWTAPTQSLMAQLSVLGTFFTEQRPVWTWVLSPTLGYTWTIGGIVSLHPGARARFGLDLGGPPAPLGEITRELAFGSVLSLGYRALPLVQVHVTPRFSLDAHATWSIDFATGALRDRYLGGATWNF